MDENLINQTLKPSFVNIVVFNSGFNDNLKSVTVSDKPTENNYPSLQCASAQLSHLASLTLGQSF